MTETITAADAENQFSQLLRDVESGKEFVVTRDGVAVARIVPEVVADAPRKLTPEQEQALKDSEEWLGRGWQLGIEKLDRDELYDNARSWMKRLK